MLVQRLCKMFTHLYKDRFPVAGTAADALRIGNLRLEHLHRSSKARKTKPGSVSRYLLRHAQCHALCVRGVLDL